MTPSFSADSLPRNSASCIVALDYIKTLSRNIYYLHLMKRYPFLLLLALTLSFDIAAQKSHFWRKCCEMEFARGSLVPC